MFRIQRNAVLVEDFQLPKTFRLRFELFLNSTQLFSDGWREIFSISDGRKFDDSELIPLTLFLNAPDQQNIPDLFKIKSENMFAQRYPDTDNPDNLWRHHPFNQVAIKPDHWLSSKKRHESFPIFYDMSYQFVRF